MLDPKVYKAPRWITTEAGQWAYVSDEQWRRSANSTFGVAERRRLLDEAERLHEREKSVAV
jgi:hypothetical protein